VRHDGIQPGFSRCRGEKRSLIVRSADLQLGGDTWNRCGYGWLNIDGNFDIGDGATGENKIFVDDTERYNMKHFSHSTSRLPFMNASVQMVYSEHMLVRGRRTPVLSTVCTALATARRERERDDASARRLLPRRRWQEHMLPLEGGGVNFLREAWRVLAPGGLMRIVTPDLAKYVCALAGHGNHGNFLEKHAARTGSTATAHRTPSAQPPATAASHRRHHPSRAHAGCAR
jgi:predicted SAM-dependent methyltransferase